MENVNEGTEEQEGLQGISEYDIAIEDNPGASSCIHTGADQREDEP